MLRKTSMCHTDQTSGVVAKFAQVYWVHIYTCTQSQEVRASCDYELITHSISWCSTLSKITNIYVIFPGFVYLYWIIIIHQSEHCNTNKPHTWDQALTHIPFAMHSMRSCGDGDDDHVPPQNLCSRFCLYVCCVPIDEIKQITVSARKSHICAAHVLFLHGLHVASQHSTHTQQGTSHSSVHTRTCTIRVHVSWPTWSSNGCKWYVIRMKCLIYSKILL